MPGERTSALVARLLGGIVAGAVGLVFVYRGLAGALHRALGVHDVIGAALGLVVVVLAGAFLARGLRSSPAEVGRR